MLPVELDEADNLRLDKLLGAGHAADRAVDIGEDAAVCTVSGAAFARKFGKLNVNEAFADGLGDSNAAVRWDQPPSLASLSEVNGIEASVMWNMKT